jgi:DNA-binding CsgD family transcriptional regulator
MEHTARDRKAKPSEDRTKRKYTKRAKPETQESHPKKLGRPPVVLDEEEVERLAGLGFSLEAIADILEVDRNTLSKHCSSVYKKGKRGLHSKLRHEMVRQAMGGNTAVLIFSLKVICGLRENGEIEAKPDEIAEFKRRWREQKDAEGGKTPVKPS